MKKIYFVRHGESLWNKTSKIQGALDIPLSKTGKKEAKLIASRFKNKEVDAIYSSKLSRAVDTAKKIGEIKGLKINEIEELKEISFGDWEGLCMEDIKENRKEELEKWIFTPEKQKFKNGESLKDVSIRTKKVLKEILNNTKDKNIVIVAHSGAIKVMVLDLLGIPLKYYKNMSLGNVSLSLVEQRDYNNVLVKFNDRNHLKEM